MPEKRTLRVGRKVIELTGDEEDFKKQVLRHARGNPWIMLPIYVVVSYAVYYALSETFDFYKFGSVTYVLFIVIIWAVTSAMQAIQVRVFAKKLMVAMSTFERDEIPKIIEENRQEEERRQKEQNQHSN